MIEDTHSLCGGSMTSAASILMTFCSIRYDIVNWYDMFVGQLDMYLALARCDGKLL